MYLCAKMRKKDDSKEQAILDAALQLVHETGLVGVKMTTIARQAGVATGTVYVYFENKEALINALYLRLKRRSTSYFLKGYKETAPFKLCFRKIWLNYLNYHLQHPEIAVFLEQYYRSPYLQANVQEERSRLLQPIFDMLERGKQELIIKDVNSEMLVAQLSGGVKELVKLHYQQVVQLTDSCIEQAFQLAWDSVKN